MHSGRIPDRRGIGSFLDRYRCAKRNRNAIAECVVCRLENDDDKDIHRLSARMVQTDGFWSAAVIYGCPRFDCWHFKATRLSLPYRIIGRTTSHWWNGQDENGIKVRADGSIRIYRLSLNYWIPMQSNGSRTLNESARGMGAPWAQSKHCKLIVSILGSAGCWGCNII